MFGASRRFESILSVPIFPILLSVLEAFGVLVIAAWEVDEVVFERLPGERVLVATFVLAVLVTPPEDFEVFTTIARITTIRTKPAARAIKTFRIGLVEAELLIGEI